MLFLAHLESSLASSALIVIATYLFHHHTIITLFIHPPATTNCPKIIHTHQHIISSISTKESNYSPILLLTNSLLHKHTSISLQHLLFPHFLLFTTTTTPLPVHRHLSPISRLSPSLGFLSPSSHVLPRYPLCVTLFPLLIFAWPLFYGISFSKPSCTTGTSPTTRTH